MSKNLVLAAHGNIRGALIFSEGGLVAITAVSGRLIVIGMAALSRSRAAAYRWLRCGILVAPLLEQVFLFYLLQLDAIIGLAHTLA